MKYHYSSSGGLDVAVKGLSRNSLRENFNIPYRIFPKTEFTHNSMDAFGKGVASAWYDSNDIAIEVEFYYPFCEVDIDGFGVLGIPVATVQRFFSDLRCELSISEDMSGFSIFEDSVRFFVPDWEESGDQALIQSVCFSLDGSKN